MSRKDDAATKARNAHTDVQGGFLSTYAVDSGAPFGVVVGGEGRASSESSLDIVKQMEPPRKRAAER